ncbi:MAG: PACE efflux transporter [Rhodobacterales bacterium]|nr:PACE efflux transporter [Pseudomonadota bacterium]MDA1285152.1 PACE efflux transporter [Pseudomonadota bacterium]
MSPILRRILYTVLFEAFGIVIAGLGLAVLSGAAVFDTGIVAALSSLVAMTWNLIFNTLFEFWETRQTTKGRSFARRAAHALGFELGLTVLLAPLLAWWLDVTLLQAFLYDLTLVVFFVIYTFLFNLAFDKVFGLPASAK